MPSKYQEYRQMADTAERQLTSSYKSWTQFLRTAARLYKYPYNEQVMIHAQRPDATACAEYDFWNKKMGRFVRRGSTGIALIDTSGQKPQLRYVFDVADTGEREHSRPMHLWQFRAEHEDAIAATLERSYDVSGSNGIVEQMESAAAQLAKEYWKDHKRDILYNIDDSYLDGYDEFNTEVQFRNAAKVSITYMLMSRCGLESEAYMEPEDFMPVFDFNTPAAVAALGTAVSEISQQVLRQIEVAIRNYERERSQNHDRIDLHEERRLPDSRHEAERGTGEQAPGQVELSKARDEAKRLQIYKANAEMLLRTDAEEQRQTREHQQEKQPCIAGRSRTGTVRSIRGLGSFAPTSKGRFPASGNLPVRQVCINAGIACQV